MASRDLTVHILGDSRSLERAFGRASSTSRGFSKSLVGLRSAAIAATAAAVGAGAAAAKSIGAASSLGEQLNKSNVVFGQNAAAIQQWSTTTASAFGLSQRAALEAAGGFGQLLQTAGLTEETSAQFSKRLVELAADMASFNNIDPSEALLKLRSGLAGEAEPLRRVGVLLSEARVKQEAYASGITKVGEELTEGEKVQARYNLILKDTAKQQGDFARTSDSFANAQRRVSAEIENAAASVGNILLPVVARATTALAEFLGDFQRARGARAKIDVVATGLENIGRDLFEQARNAIDAIDWNAAIATARDGLIAALRSLGELVGRVDWGSVGRNVGRLLASAFEQTAAFLRSVDWENVGGAIVRGIGDFLKSVDWRAVAVGAIKLLVATLKATASLLLGVGKELGKAIIGGIGDGLDAAKDFVLRKLLEFVRRILGITEFLGRFDPFKGTRQKIQATLDGMVADARNAAVRTNAALSQIQDKTITVTVATVITGEGPGAGETATRRGNAGAIITGAVSDVITGALKAANAVIEGSKGAVAIQESAAAKAEDSAKKVKAATDRQRKSLEEIREAAREALQARQFRALGLSATGGEIIPGIDNLKKQLDSLSDRVLGEGLSSKLVNRLAGVRKLLSGQFGKLTEETRAAINDLFKAIRDEFDKDSIEGPLTKTTALNTGKILDGLGLGRDAERELRARLSRFNSAGLALAGAGQARTGSFTGAISQPINMNLTVVSELDGQTVAKATTRAQTKTRRGTKQKRGPNRRSGI